MEINKYNFDLDPSQIKNANTTKFEVDYDKIFKDTLFRNQRDIIETNNKQEVALNSVRKSTHKNLKIRKKLNQRLTNRESVKVSIDSPSG